ncbi:hypothetical protein QUC31_010707 [Theobroma cacao]|uniref:Uncharacterized protein LOC18598728 n=2 Tax=Theobroma cacao TaxID=3641 RepID=A0AB32V4C9_THECC|nr:PREDICTED: uncharacterized protein LOC18598728 [Theobroma cacao]EOY08946.1 VQ motif-containing protein, putative [Theobroma cacao]
MDNSLGSLQHSKAAKKAKSKKKKNNNKPIKVVYISNPMKVKTSASKFRALVQELTGQDAELPDPTKFTDTDDDDVGSNQKVPDAVKNSTDDHALEVPRVGDQAVHHHEQPTRAHHDVPFETFDEVFTPQMLREFDRVLASEPFLMNNLDALRSL